MTFRSDRTSTSQTDSSMTKINRSTYSAISNKLTKGTPNQYYVQRFSEKVVVTFYPTPDSTAATKDAHMYFVKRIQDAGAYTNTCLLYTSPSPRDGLLSRMPSSA